MNQELVFDPHTQTVKRVIPPPSADAANTIAVRLRPGFRSGKHMLRREDVAVHDDPEARAAARRFRDVLGTFASGKSTLKLMSEVCVISTLPS